MNRTRCLFSGILLSLLLFLFAGAAGAQDAPEGPSVYITIAGHIEDTAIYADCNAYPDFRSRLLTFADMLSQTGAAFNLQIDYEFLAGTARCETEAMRGETGGLNIIDYLATHYGFEIDAHQEGGTEEGLDNYADVRYLGGTLTSLMSGNVGGLVWDDSDQFARLAQGEPGLLYPQFRWFPDVLTLAVGHRHHTGDFSDDDVASGIWRPKGANANFWVHDPDERMVYIGPGEHTDWGRRDEHLSSPEFVKHLVDALEAGTIPRDRMYTVTLAVPQSVIFDADMHTDLTAKLNEIAPYIRSGQAGYVTYSEAYDIWMTHFGGQPTLYHRAGTVPRFPVIETTAVSSVTSSTASSGGHVASDGWAAVTARGVCWSTSSNPTLVDSHTVDGTGTGPFESAITGLSPGSTYHVRAYATNSVGTAYGSDLSFTSSSTNLPVPDIKANGLKGAVTVSAGSPVSITVGLDPGMYAGANADWWIAVHTPFSPPLDWYTYVVSIGWMQGIHLCAQTGLLKLSPVELLNRVLPSGNYVFYFAIDDPDRSPTGPWWGLDSVTVIVQ